MQQVFKEVKENHLKIGIIEENVTNIIATVKTFRDLGINAVPIIGTSNELKYLKKYYTSLEDKEDIEDDMILKYLSGGCVVKSLANDNEGLGNNPCNRLREGGEKVTCPYWNICGGVFRQRELSNADVIVTTPHSLIKGELPSFIDQYNRSIYEMFHDVLDLIIVDEADGIQSILDAQLMPNSHLNYGLNSIIDGLKNFNNDISKYRRNIEKFSVYSLSKNTIKLESILIVATRIILKFKRAKTFIRNKIFTPIEIMKEIEGILKKAEGNEKFIEFLESYVKFTDTHNITEETIEHELNRLYYKIESIHLIQNGYPEEVIKEKIREYFEKYNVKLPKNSRGKNIDEELFIEKICFLILLVQIDYTLKFIGNEYASMKYELGGDVCRIDALEGINSKIFHLIKEPCLGTVYGYKFTQDTGVNIDVLRYIGVGRNLLDNWCDLKSDIGVEGPAVICLSGTSYSPGSAHYNLKRSPDILLKGKSEGKIKMNFIPKFYEDRYIKISGSGIENKEDNLKELTKKIINELKYQLEVSDRKILVVVNSFDDCSVVGDVLNYYRLRYKILGREEDSDKNRITKDNLEQFADITEGADICVVPLTIISRGYNILSNDGNSYFGSLFFMIRPYMVPGDFNSYIQLLHHSLNIITENVIWQYTDYNLRLSNLRKFCYVAYKKILEISYWGKLDEDEREIMSWFMIVPIKQAIGRMQRNGNDCEVFFCDISFCNALAKSENQDENNSIFFAWYNVLKKYMDDEVIKALYGNFFIALEEMIENIQSQIDSNKYEGGEY